MATGHALVDHLAWCLGGPIENLQLLEAVAARDGELTQAALVAEARRRRARRMDEDR